MDQVSYRLSSCSPELFENGHDHDYFHTGSKVSWQDHSAIKNFTVESSSVASLDMDKIILILLVL